MRRSAATVISGTYACATKRSEGTAPQFSRGIGGFSIILSTKNFEGKYTWLLPHTKSGQEDDKMCVVAISSE